MKYAHFAPLNRDLSRLVLGSMVFRPQAPEIVDPLLDAWREAGGNVVDTAHLYNSGDSERMLGRWIASRGKREQLVLLTKGAYPNVDRRRVTPEDITCDLRDSLVRLQTEYIDLYFLHRDDPDVPVEAIVDALNEHHQAGRIRAFGASNWSTARLDAANAYAAREGLLGFAASSPHLSLAAPNGEIWPGCLDARSPADLAWYCAHQLPMFAWSSQARGFFSGEFMPENVAENEFQQRVYNNPENWARYRRAEQIGAPRGFSTIQVALAWVLNQPFPVFPIIGPATVAELHSSLRALELPLTLEELEWLDLGTEFAV